VLKFNKKGFGYMVSYSDNGDTTELNQAIDLFKQAIKCDSTYLNAYMNVANAYDHKKSYDEEMGVFNKLLSLTKNQPTILTLKGILFDKMNEPDSAKQAYYLANTGFEKGLIKDPDNIKLIDGKILLTALTEGKDAAIEELNVQIKQHPKLSTNLANEHTFYRYFDKHTFIYGLATEIPLGKW
jgi:tetratricopeptide (TPR) repeat protein